MPEEVAKNKKKSLSREIIRFAITGVIATLVDLGVTSLAAAFLPDSLGSWEEPIVTAIGFVVSLAVNWVLSTFWVYKNVDESVNPKSGKNIVLFIVFSVIGLLIGSGLMWLFGVLDNVALKTDFINWAEFIRDSSMKFNFLQFFIFCVCFGTKTLITMFWNYISRKLWIYKSPERINKENEK